MNEKFSITATSYLDKLQATLAALDRDQIDHAVGLVTAAWENGHQIITLGNGGSSLTALHFINDWNKSIYLSSGRSFRGRSLLDNVGLIMSYSNDISFEDMFVEQLKNIIVGSRKSVRRSRRTEKRRVRPRRRPLWPLEIRRLPWRLSFLRSMMSTIATRRRVPSLTS